MLRALSLREYRKSVIVHAAILGTLLGLLMAFERLAPRMGMSAAADPDFLHLLLIAGLVASGFMSGERCFSASFKEGRYYFLTALPLPRVRLWAALCFPRLLGAWTAILSFLGLRFALVNWAPSEVTIGRYSLLAVVAGFLTAHAVSFLTGSTLALAMRRELFVYVVGLPLLAFLITTAGVNLAYGFDFGFPDVLGLFLIRVTALGVLLVFLMAAIGGRSFVRGEFDRWRQRLGALTLIILLAAGHLASTHLLAFNRFMVRLGDEWIQSGPLDWFRISPDGEHVVVRQRLRYRPVFSKFEILDAKSGSRLGAYEIFSLSRLEWSGTGKTLNAMATDNDVALRCIWLPCRAKPRWFRFTRAAKKVAQMDLDSLGDIHGSPGTAASFIITWDGEQGKAYKVGDQGPPKEVWQGDSLQPIQVRLGVSGLILTTTVGKGRNREWGLSSDGSVGNPSGLWRRESLELRDSLIMAADTLPFDHGQSIKVGPGYPAKYGMYFLERKEEAGLLNLWHFDGRSNWQPVLLDLPASGNDWVPTFDPLGHIREDRKPGIHWATGIVAFVETRSGYDSLGFFSGTLRRHRSTSVRCLPTEEGTVNFERLRDGKALVRFSCGRDGVWRSRFFLYPSDSGHIRQIEGLPLDLPSYAEWLHLGDDGFLIWSIFHKEIWSLSPGSSPRRIWPSAEEQGS